MFYFSVVVEIYTWVFLLNNFIFPNSFTVSTAFGNSQSLWESPYSHPYFDNSTRRDMTITVGQTANLHCKVRNLGDRAVSVFRCNSNLHSHDTSLLGLWWLCDGGELWLIIYGVADSDRQFIVWNVRNPFPDFFL